MIRTLSIVVVSCLVGFAIGRFVAPPKVVETVRVDTEAEEKVRELTAHAEVLKQMIRRIETTTTRPDGTKRTRIVTETKNDRTVSETTDRKEERAIETTKVVERTLPRPDWRVGALVGMDLRTGSVGYGGAVERRILGPVSAGAWGLSSGHAGLSLSLEF